MLTSLATRRAAARRSSSSMEAPLLEEGALDPADQVLDRALLLGAGTASTARPRSRGRAPPSAKVGFHSVTSPSLRPLERDRLGPVEDRQQRHAAEARRSGRPARAPASRPARSATSVHLDPARVLQPRGEEVDRASRRRPRSARRPGRSRAGENSPGSPSKRTTSRILGGRSPAISSYSALLPPV